MEFFVNNFIGKIIVTFFVSMLPVIELRGAIPIGVGLGINIWLSIFISVLGNLVPVPFIILFIENIFNWMKHVCKPFQKIVVFFEKKANKHSGKIEKYGFWGLFILVAIPLPGTGAWTGALVAAMLNIKLKQSFPAIGLGVIIAGIIVSIFTYMGFNIL